jgi:hypothetical protein
MTRLWRRASHRRQPHLPGDFRVRIGIAGLGGALGAEILRLDPTFPLKFMIYFLIVVAWAARPRSRALWLPLLGIADVAGNITFPNSARSSSTASAIAILMVRQGLLREPAENDPRIRRRRLQILPQDFARGPRFAGNCAVARRAAVVVRAARQAPMLNEMAILALFAVSST